VPVIDKQEGYHPYEDVGRANHETVHGPHVGGLAKHLSINSVPSSWNFRHNQFSGVAAECKLCKLCKLCKPCCWSCICGTARWLPHVNVTVTASGSWGPARVLE
jgi:hypothetical protein